MDFVLAVFALALVVLALARSFLCWCGVFIVLAGGGTCAGSRWSILSSNVLVCVVPVSVHAGAGIGLFILLVGTG